MKCVQIRSVFWSVFSHIRTEYGEILRKYGPEKTPFLDTFHAVLMIIAQADDSLLVKEYTGEDFRKSF